MQIARQVEDSQFQMMFRRLSSQSCQLVFFDPGIINTHYVQAVLFQTTRFVSQNIKSAALQCLHERLYITFFFGLPETSDHPAHSFIEHRVIVIVVISQHRISTKTRTAAQNVFYIRNTGFVLEDITSQNNQIEIIIGNFSKEVDFVALRLRQMQV